MENQENDGDNFGFSHSLNPSYNDPIAANHHLSEINQVMTKLDYIEKMIRAGYDQTGYVKLNGVWVQL